MCVFLFDEKAFGLIAGMGSRQSMPESPTFVLFIPVIPDKLKKLNFARIACLKPFGEKAERRAGEEVNVCSVVITQYLFPAFPALRRHGDGRDGRRLGLRRREDGRHGELGRSQ